MMISVDIAANGKLSEISCRGNETASGLAQTSFNKGMGTT